MIPESRWQSGIQDGQPSPVRFSVESVKEAGWKLDAVTYDLHHDEELCQGNVMTEYEEKFSSKGNPIHKLIAVR